MSGFADFEPRVGEIRAVRTFRVGPGGLLFPLFSARPWVAGTNEAACNLSLEAHHLPPDPKCTCGFYAYADEQAAREYPYARYVLAVVACWGRVVAGTRGLRAQYMHIEAVWLSDQIPNELAAMVAAQYPTTSIHADRAAMLSAYPLTALDTYEDDRPPTQRGPARWAERAVISSALAAGLVPTEVIGRLPFGWVVWAVVFVVVLGAALDPRQHRIDSARHKRRVLCAALLLWMVAPLGGIIGLVFLRLPLVQIAVLLEARRVAFNRLARTFPAPI